MKRNFGLLAIATILILSYQNCAEEFDPGQLTIKSVTPGPEPEQPPVERAFYHQISLQKTAISQDESLEIYVDKNMDPRDVTVTWEKKCPEDNSLTSVNSSSCNGNRSCYSLQCSEVGAAEIHAKLFFEGNQKLKLSRFVQINKKTLVEKKPEIVLPTNLKVNTNFDAKIVLPSVIPQNEKSEATINWSLSNGCTSTNSSSGSTLRTKCSSWGTYNVEVSYSTRSYFGSATKSFTINENISFLLSGSLKVGTARDLIIQYQDKAGLSIDWSTNKSECKISNVRQVGNVKYGSLLCSSMPSGESVKVKGSGSNSGASISGESSAINVEKGSISLSLKVLDPVSAFANSDVLLVGTKPSSLTNLTYIWHANPGCTFKASNTLKPSLNCTSGGVKSVKLTAYNDDYEGSVTKIVYIKSEIPVEPTSCTWSSYANSYDGYLNFNCPANKVVAGVSSAFSSRHKDRVFRYKCCSLKAGSKNLTITSIIASGYRNTYDNQLNYSCPDNKVITGSVSYHNNRKEDRQFGFDCGSPKYDNNTVEKYECSAAPYLNKWQSYFSYSCPEGKVLGGEKSYHLNSKEDRNFQYTCCKLRVKN